MGTLTTWKGMLERFERELESGMHAISASMGGDLRVPICVHQRDLRAVSPLRQQPYRAVRTEIEHED